MSIGVPDSILRMPALPLEVIFWNLQESSSDALGSEPEVLEILKTPCWF